MMLSAVTIDPACWLKGAALWWRNQREGRRALSALDRSSLSEMSRTAHDFGIAVDRLRSFAVRGPLSAELMQRMAMAHGLKAEALRRNDLNTIREMEERCTVCGYRLRCARDLAQVDAPARAESYCPNFEAFKALTR